MTRYTREQTESEIDDLLRPRRQLAVIWTTFDVRRVRPDLNEDQAWAVLDGCRKTRNSNGGVTRTDFKTIADYLFPIGRQD